MLPHKVELAVVSLRRAHGFPQQGLVEVNDDPTGTRSWLLGATWVSSLTATKIFPARRRIAARLSFFPVRIESSHQMYCPGSEEEREVTFEVTDPATGAATSAAYANVLESLYQ